MNQVILNKVFFLLRYVIGRSDDDSKPSFIVKILDKLRFGIALHQFIYVLPRLYFFVGNQSYH
jgi:hypothetical protein